MAKEDIIHTSVSGLTNFNMGSPVFNKIFFYGKVFLALAIFVFGSISIWKFWLQYKHKVVVLIKSGGKVVDIVYDRAKIIEIDEQGKRKLVLFKLRKTCPPPKHDYKYKSGKKDLYFLYLDDNGQLHPCEVGDIREDSKQFIQPEPEERKAWGRIELKNAWDRIKKKDWIEKYGATVVIITACTFSFLIFFFGFQELGRGMSQLAAQFGQIATSCMSLP